jgi:hypothetical protein
MESIDGREILRLLGLGEGQNVIWSIFLYIIFFFGLITMFLIPDKNMVPTLLTGAVLLMAIVAKVSLASSDPIFRRTEFGMMLINVGMAALPFMVAGMVRSGKRRSKAQAPAIIGGIFGLVYFFLFLVIVQRA